MNHLVVDLALHRLSKAVLVCLQELENSPSLIQNRNIAVRCQDLHNSGEITKEEYIFLYTRILLNEFCYKMEDQIGKGVVTGFLFYSNENSKIYYEAGANYPTFLKEFLHHRTPTVDLEGNDHYENDIFIVNTLDTWKNDRQNFSKQFKKTNIKSLMSKRMRLNDFTYGTFECYYPYEYGPNEEDIALIRKELQPIKEQLFHLRSEMEDALKEIHESFPYFEKTISS